MGYRARMTDRALESLEHYAFPGNVRELEHMIEQAVALVQDRAISADDLMPGRVAAARPRASGGGRPLAVAVDEAERESIEAALREAEGSRERAADMLEISPTTLWRKMTRLGIVFEARST